MIHPIISPSNRALIPPLAEVGGKGYHLWQMQKAGLPVPDFMVLPCAMIDALLAPLRAEIEPDCAAIQGIDDPQLPTIAKRIGQRIERLVLSTEWQERILESCREKFGDTYWLAVRSSAASEDGAAASFAGQHATYLYVEEKHLLRSVLSCIASAWNQGALSYRLAHGLSIQEIQFAVVIQKMVAAVKSGIGFSMNLQGNLADMIFVAGYGLGEGIVSDQVETDTYIVNRQSRAMEKKKIQKKVSLVFDPKKGVIKVPVEASKRELAVLDEAEILQAFDFALATEQLLGKPVDIEFSFDKEGRFYLLQMRPITSLNLDDLKILDNTNIVESYPNITLPLSFSFALQAYEKVFTGSSKAFWISDEILQKDATVFKNLLAHFNGRIYYRLDNWYRMMSLVYSSKKSMQAWEKAVGLMQSESDKVTFSFGNKMRILFSSIWLILNYRRGNKRFFNLFYKNYKALKDYKKHLSTPQDLWKHYETVTAQLFRPWYLTLINDFLAFKFFGCLQDLVKKYQLGTKETLANDLLCGTGGVESEEAVIAVLKLKAHIQSDEALTALFALPPATIMTYFEAEEYQTFFHRVRNYLECYGDRTLAELKLETPSLRRQPQQFIQLLKNQLASNLGIADFRFQQQQIKIQAKQAVAARLKWWNPRRLLFSWVRKMAAYGLKNRENMRFCRTRAYAGVKDIFLAIGAMMVKAKCLPHAEAVFYLELSDLENFCLNGNREDLSDKAESLQKKYLAFSELSLPDRIIYANDALPVFGKKTTRMSRAGDMHEGISVSKGTITAEAAVVLEPSLDLKVSGKILVSKMTDPGWVFLMTQAVGLISEKGSLLSHTAIVGRELGIPVVVGIAGATTIFKSGDLLCLDGTQGIVTRKSPRAVERKPKNVIL